jgi:polar amino acid transport system ATP-binding protein
MPIVALRNVSKTFGTHVALDSVDLDVEAGSITAIIGRSGSGKSTLLRCINGLEPIDRGTIEVNGSRVKRDRASLRRLRQEVGIVFQNFNLFPHLTAEANVTLGPLKGKGVPAKEATLRARSALAEVGLSDKLDAYPSRLSGGQQQRVAIARALAMQPALLLFDEITSALDPELTSEVVGVLEQLALRKKTMILVTHEMGFARRTATRVIFMHQSRIWEQGAPEQMFAAPQTPELQLFIAAVLGRG